jgi:hypothetical protein
VKFESGSRLERINESVFAESGLKSIVIPSSVVASGESLEYMAFENGSRLEQTDEPACLSLE